MRWLPCAVVAIAVAGALVSCESDSLPTEPSLESRETVTKLELQRIEASGGLPALLARWPRQADAVRYEWRIVRDSDSDPAWQSTKRTELEIPLDESSNELMRLELRAVDANGRTVGVPQTRGFNAHSIAPTVHISYPAIGWDRCQDSSTHVYFEWVGEDEDSPFGLPRESRWILLEVESCMTRIEYRETKPFDAIADDDPRWSEWKRYRPRGHNAELPESVELADLEPGRFFLFAVQVRDQHRLVNLGFQWGWNVRSIGISTSPKFPVLTVEEELLGSSDFAGPNGRSEYELISGYATRFHVEASAEQYSGRIDAVRYGWDLLDPADPDDPGWDGAWQDYETRSDPTPRSFDGGVHEFTVQVRDSAGGLTRARYALRILPLPPLAERKELLLIDDDRRSLGDSDARWADLIDAALPDGAEWDAIDASTEPQRVTLATLLRYRAVVWRTSMSTYSFFATHFPEGARQYNWVETYQRYAGNMLRVGPGAVRSTLPDAAGTVWPAALQGMPAPLGVGGGAPGYAAELFCLDVLDVVRPPIGFIWGEHNTIGRIMRRLPCDGLASATPAPEFAARFVSAASLPALRPSAPRVDRDPIYQLHNEEFFDWNATERPLVVEPRDCIVPMFRWSSYGAEGMSDPGSCEASAVDGAPTAVASFAASDTRPWPGTADFLWGFDPLAFEQEDVVAALSWIFGEHWQLAP